MVKLFSRGDGRKKENSNHVLVLACTRGKAWDRGWRWEEGGAEWFLALF